MLSKIRLLSLVLIITISESIYCNITIFNYKNNMIKTFSCSVTSGVPLPKEGDRGGHISGIVENKIIISGGNRWSEDKTQKYFLESTLLFDNQKWIEGPSLPIPMANSMFAYDSSGIYIAGGTSDGITMLKDVYVLRSLQNGEKWERLPDLPEALGFGAGAIINNTFYVSGGLLNNGEKINKMWALDLNNIESGWIESKSIPGVPRYLHAMTACGDNLYVMGGLAESTPLTPLDEVYKFNYKENRWDKLKDLPLKGYAWVAQPIDDTNILITGRADGKIHQGIWIINLKTISMDKVGDLIVQSTTAPLVKVTDNQWWLIGGEPDSNKKRTKEISIINIIDNENGNCIH